VFGEVVSPADQEVVNSIRQGDRIRQMVVEGDCTSLFERIKGDLDAWNRTLDECFPKLKPT
jgi:peptidyl-prolyl cis-trans isomerase B (cyclophilin B)